MQMTSENLALIGRWLDALNRTDRDEFAGLLTPDVTFTFSHPLPAKSTTLRDREAVMGSYTGWRQRSLTCRPGHAPSFMQEGRPGRSLLRMFGLRHRQRESILAWRAPSARIATRTQPRHAIGDGSTKNRARRSPRRTSAVPKRGNSVVAPGQGSLGLSNRRSPAPPEAPPTPPLHIHAKSRDGQDQAESSRGCPSTQAFLYPARPPAGLPGLRQRDQAR